MTSNVGFGMYSLIRPLMTIFVRPRCDPAGFDEKYWRRGLDLGWTSLLVAEEHGGGSISGDGLVDLTLVAYEFGRHAAPGPLVPSNVVATALDAARTGAHAGLIG